MARPLYEALDASCNPIVRPAAVVHELPSPAELLSALASTTTAIADILNRPAARRIYFGLPVHAVFGFTREQAKRHQLSQLLLTPGHILSLAFCPEYR